MSDEQYDDALAEEDFIERQRVSLMEHKELHQFSWDTIAKKSGIARGTISSFGNGSYAGNRLSVAKDVERYLLAFAEQRKIKTLAADGPKFEMTPTADKICGVLNWAHTLGSVGVVVGEPGLGKTATFNKYCEGTPHAYLSTLRREIKTLPRLYCEIANALKIRSYNYINVRARILDHVRGASPLLIVDECQHATMEMLDELRSLNDLNGFAIIFAGNLSVLGNIQSEKAQFAQLSSRIGLRLKLSKPMAGDITAYAKAWGVDDDDCMTVLKQIGSKPGALRNIKQVMGLATLTAAGQKRDSVTASDIRNAWRNLSESEVTV